MVNTRRKGNRTRLEIIKHLIKNGYQVAIVERTGKFIKEKDAFGFVDLIAVNEKEMKLIQAKTNNKGKAEWLKMVEFLRNHPISVLSCEIWNKIDRKGFEVTFVRFNELMDLVSKTYRLVKKDGDFVREAC